MVQLVHLVHLVEMELLATLVLKEKLEFLVVVVLLDPTDEKAHQEKMVAPDLLEPPERMVKLDLLDLKVPSVLPVQWDLPEEMVKQAHLVTLPDHPDHMDHLVFKDLQVQLVTLGL